MDEIKQEDWLDRQLREAAPYIDDEGFTARVLQQLPPPRNARRSFRGAILLTITLLASVLAYLLSDGGRFLVVEATRLTTLPTFTTATCHPNSTTSKAPPRCGTPLNTSTPR